MKPHERQLLVAVLIAHQRMDIRGCLCGWNKLGHNHAEHVADCYSAALGGLYESE